MMDIDLNNHLPNHVFGIISSLDLEDTNFEIVNKHIVFITYSPHCFAKRKLRKTTTNCITQCPHLIASKSLNFEKGRFTRYREQIHLPKKCKWTFLEACPGRPERPPGVQFMSSFSKINIASRSGYSHFFSEPSIFCFT